MKNLSRLVAAAAVTVGTVTVTTSEVVEAYPTSCTSSISRFVYQDYATHVCLYGTGYITAYAKCDSHSSAGTPTYVKRGPVVKSSYNIRVVVKITCPIGEWYMISTWRTVSNL